SAPTESHAAAPSARLEDVPIARRIVALPGHSSRLTRVASPPAPRSPAIFGIPEPHAVAARAASGDGVGAALSRHRAHVPRLVCLAELSGGADCRARGHRARGRAAR